MCGTLGKLMGLSVGILVLGLSSVAAAQGVWRPQGSSLGRAGYYAATYYQPSMANPTYMNHFVGRAARHNAYQQARLQGMYVRLQQEKVRGEIVRVKRQHELERRYASLKQPRSSQRSASTSTATTPTADNGYFLNQQDVTAPARTLQRLGGDSFDSQRANCPPQFSTAAYSPSTKPIRPRIWQSQLASDAYRHRTFSRRRTAHERTARRVGTRRARPDLTGCDPAAEDDRPCPP